MRAHCLAADPRIEFKSFLAPDPEGPEEQAPATSSLVTVAAAATAVDAAASVEG